MRNKYRSAALLSLLMLAGCSAGERGMTSPHQPLVSAHAATTPGCPDWSDSKLSGTTDAMSSNYGCADAVNLAAMIADPADLVHGKTGGANSVEVAVRSVRAWREYAPTSKNWDVTAKVSAKGGN